LVLSQEMSVLMKVIRQALLYWMPVVAYIVIITYFSSVPERKLPLPFLSQGMDKVCHIVEYMGLGLLFSRAWLLSRSESAGSHRGVFIATAVFAVAVGISDEWHQSSVPGRTFSIWDAFADILGSLSGAFLTQKWLERRVHD
jgi:VanZ family protein